MVISDTKKFIFCHIPKAAGTSMERALSSYATTNKWITNPSFRKKWRNRNVAHSPLYVIKTAFRNKGVNFNEYFKFAFVRNPWDRFVSSYEFILARPTHPAHNNLKNLGSFDKYIRSLNFNNWMKNHGQLLFLREGNKILADFVGRFENIKDDWAWLCRKLDIEAPLPFFNVTKHKPYWEYYTDETRIMVAHGCKKEIKKLGYTFRT